MVIAKEELNALYLLFALPYFSMLEKEIHVVVYLEQRRNIRCEQDPIYHPIY